jgi:hypothetical protein
MDERRSAASTDKESQAERNVPFVFTTGYDRSMLPAEYLGRPILAKPFKPSTMVDVLAALL